MRNQNKLKSYKLKYVFPPKYCSTCGQVINTDKRHLIVLASNKEEAILMRRYLLNEGFEV